MHVEMCILFTMLLKDVIIERGIRSSIGEDRHVGCRKQSM